MFIKKLAFICFSSTLSFNALADMQTAYEAAQNKDYPLAAKHFQQSANLGHAKAQNVLAQLHLHGAGVEKNPVLAYVYFALSNEQTPSEKSKQAAKAVLARLSKEQQKIAQQTLNQYQQKIGKTVLNEQIMPTLANNPFILSPAKKVRGSKSVMQSSFTVRKVKLSSAILEYDIAPDGSIQDVGVAYSYFSSDKLLQDMIRSTYSGRFAQKQQQRYQENHIEDQRSIWAQRDVNKAAIKGDSKNFYKHFIQLETLAAKGNANAQYELGMYIIAFPSLNTNQIKAVDFMKKAADSGHANAAAEYAYYLFKGKGVKQDFTAGLNYLVRAAKDGNGRAQYRLGREFLSGQIIKKDHKKALFWLQQAEDAGDKNATFWLARTLLVQKNIQPTQINLAQTLLEKSEKSQENNPNWYYYVSQAELAQNNIESAVKSLNNAIDLASDFDWDVSKWQAELLQIQPVS